MNSLWKETDRCPKCGGAQVSFEWIAPTALGVKDDAVRITCNACGYYRLVDPLDRRVPDGR